MLAEAGYSVPGHVAAPREPLVSRRMQALLIVFVGMLVWYFFIATNPMVIRAKAIVAADPAIVAMVGPDPDIWNLRARQWGYRADGQATGGRYQFLVRGNGRVQFVEIDVWQDDEGRWQARLAK
jgi:hypothetical protein